MGPAADHQDTAPTEVVLVAHDVGGLGGMEGVLGEIVRGAPERFRVHVVSATLDADLVGRVVWHRVPVPRRPFPLRFLAFAALAPWRLRQVDADLCQVTGAIVPTRADIASVHYCHRVYASRTGRATPRGLPLLRRVNSSLTAALSRGLERWCYRPGRVRVLAAVSEPAAADLRRHFPGVEVTVTPNGVDLSRFRPGVGDRVSLRAAMGAGEEDLVVLFVGGDWWRKGLWALVDGVGRAAAAGAPVHLWVAGRGPERRLRRAARRAGVEQVVRALGPRRDVPALMTAADVLVLPSAYETTPLVVLEAAAAGLPAITTPVGEAGQLIARTGAGVVVDPADLSLALGRALSELADDPERLDSMRGRAQAAVRSRDWDAVTAATYALWDRLSAPRPGPGEAAGPGPGG